MDALRIFSNRLINTLQSVLLLGGMAMLAGYIGWLLFGPGAVIWAAAAVMLAIVFTPRLSARWILRTSGAQEIAPPQAPEAYRLLALISERAGLARIPRLYYVPSRVLNAFAVDGPDDAAIAVTDGLLRALDLRELCAVLAHEVSHIRSGDIWVMTLADVVGRLTVILSLAGQVLLFALLPLAVLGGYALPLMPLAILVVAPLIATALQLALSRTREYRADLGAAELTGDPRGLALALDKLERLQGGWMERMYISGERIPKWLRTHPPMAERIRRLFDLEPAPVQPVLPASPLQAQRMSKEWPAVVSRPRWHWNGMWY